MLHCGRQVAVRMGRAGLWRCVAAAWRGRSKPAITASAFPVLMLSWLCPQCSVNRSRLLCQVVRQGKGPAPRGAFLYGAVKQPRLTLFRTVLRTLTASAQLLYSVCVLSARCGLCPTRLSNVMVVFGGPYSQRGPSPCEERGAASRPGRMEDLKGGTPVPIFAT